jgi:hypothetical protein
MSHSIVGIIILRFFSIKITLIIYITKIIYIFIVLCNYSILFPSILESITFSHILVPLSHHTKLKLYEIVLATFEKYNFEN